VGVDIGVGVEPTVNGEGVDGPAVVREPVGAKWLMMKSLMFVVQMRMLSRLEIGIGMI
jgi:hypothetical protein